MLTDEQRIKIYGSAEAVAAVDQRIAETVDTWPPLSQRQKDAIRVLLAKPAPGVEILPAPRRAVLAA